MGERESVVAPGEQVARPQPEAGVAANLHTPGPWRVFDPVAVDYRAPVVFGDDGQSLVATAEGGGPTKAIDAPTARANASLIAAAPDLLAELKWCFIGAGNIARMGAAIAKAEGRSNA